MDKGTTKMRKGRSPTIGDVARLAGVSPTTVSFVLNDVVGSGISEPTRMRVRASAREIRYRPNATARLLRTDRSHAIGFVTDEIASTPFAGDVIKGAQEAAWEAGRSRNPPSG
jgi:LacI family transcriptional regulator